MRWLGSLWVGGWALSSVVFAQEPGVVTFDLITLRMPVELATPLQHRIDEGGQAAATAVDRLPALAKDKKLDELDRWHLAVENGTASKREIATGLDLKMSNGEIVPVGLNIELQPYLATSGLVDVRMSLQETSPIKGDRDHYLVRHAHSAASIAENEWVNLASWRDQDQVVIFLARFGGSDDARKEEEDRDNAMQSSARYSLCMLADGAVRTGFHQQVSGAPALELLKNAQVLEAGSILFRRDQKWITGSNSNPLDLEKTAELGRFALDGCLLLSADQRIAEAGILVEWAPLHGAGKPRRSVAFSDWLELPVGTVTMIPLSDTAGAESLWLALELRTESILPAPIAAEGVVVPPGTRRLLAEAAGLPVPKPSSKKQGFEALPTVRESLEKLGLELPEGVELRLIPSGPVILLIGKDASYTRLREILAKYLPTSVAAPDTTETK